MGTATFSIQLKSLGSCFKHKPNVFSQLKKVPVPISNRKGTCPHLQCGVAHEVHNPFLQRAMRAAQATRPRRSHRQSYEWRREEVPGRAMALLWFLTRGCGHDGCTMCDYGAGPKVGAAAMVTAVRTGLAELAGTGLGHLAVTPSGSMLDPKEVPPAARAAIFEMMNDFDVPDVFFETRAETITAEAVAEVRAAIPNKRVGTTIGLETSSAYLQRFAVNKGSHPSWVVTAIEHLHAGGISAMLDHGVGTPFLSPAEAIDDAVTSVRWSIDHGADVAVLLPIHVRDHTVAGTLFRLGLYQPPSWWSLVEALRRLGPGVSETVSISWYKNYTTATLLASPDTCPECHDRVLALLDRYRAEQSFAVVEELSAIECACKDAWRTTLESDSPPLPERILASYEALADALDLREVWEQHRGELEPAIRAAYLDDVYFGCAPKP